GPRRRGVGQVEAVDVRVLDDVREGVRDLRRRTDEVLALPAHTAQLDDVAYGPRLPVRVLAPEGLERGLDRVRLHVPQRLVEVVRRQIGAQPSGEEHLRALDTRVRQEVLVLRAGAGGRFVR